jgi:hypothetical protein
MMAHAIRRLATVGLAITTLSFTLMGAPAIGRPIADCSSASWPPYRAPDVAALVQTAQRDAAVGDPVAQWLLGALYLWGTGMPQDRGAGIKWIETAARTAVPSMSGPGALSEMELYAGMSEAANALPTLIGRDGLLVGISEAYVHMRTMLEALSGCLDKLQKR